MRYSIHVYKSNCLQVSNQEFLLLSLPVLEYSGAQENKRVLPTCIAVHDLSCHAKSSLTIVIPILEAMGVEVSPLPTALLSTQTDGYDGYSFDDQTEAMERIISHWESLGVSARALYSGFLGSVEQIALVERLMPLISRGYSESGTDASPVILVDPVMGDGGQLYGPISPDMVPALRRLVAQASVITPNTTEACLLCGRPWQESWTTMDIMKLLDCLRTLTNAHIVITGISLQDDDERHYAVAYSDAVSGEQGIYQHDREKASLPGSGDMFASLCCGFLLQGGSFSSAVMHSSDMTALAVRRTLQAGYGIAPALIIPELVQEWHLKLQAPRT